MFHQKISELKNLGYKSFHQTKNGEYILSVNNKLIFTDGNFDAPSISRVIVVNAEYESIIEEVRDTVYEIEEGYGSKVDSMVHFYEGLSNEGIVTEYNMRDGAIYKGTAQGSERSYIGEIDPNHSELRDGRRNASESKSDLRRARDDGGGVI